MKSILEVRADLGKLWDEARAIEEKADTEKRDLSADELTRSGELTTQMDALTATIARREKQEGYAGAKMEQSSAKAHPAKTTADTAEAIFCRALRTGDPSAQAELRDAVIAEYRASNATDMNITTAADGGYLVPVGHYQGIIERARDEALYSKLGVRMIPGKGTTVNVPLDAEADNGAFVVTAESALFDLDAPALTQLAMTLVKYTKRVVLTYELMEDEDSRLMDFLNTYVAKGFAATVNTLMIAEALANGTAALTLAGAAAITPAELVALLYTLPAAYASGPDVAFVLRRATEGYLRGLTGNPFQFGFTTSDVATGRSINSTLLGVPVYAADDVGALAASGKSVIVGNWNYMGMRLDPGMTLVRDPYTRSSYGEVVLNYHFRVDFAVLQAAAIRYATHPTA